MQIDPKNIKQQNTALRKTSKLLFGDSAELRIVDPAGLQLLKENARFFKKDQFKQLVENLRKDQRLSSVPLCHQLKGDKLEVLSGNHRVQAAIEAKIEWILVIVILGDINKNEKLAIQLSHNALVGQDDPHILANLWAQIDDIKAKVYAGLSSDLLNELEDVKLVTFTTPSVATKQLTFLFTPPEKDKIERVLEALGKLPAKEVIIADLASFDAFFETLEKLKKAKDIKNGSLAVLQLIDIAQDHLEAEACHS